jgi:hypothetical protein
MHHVDRVSRLSRSGSDAMRQARSEVNAIPRDQDLARDALRSSDQAFKLAANDYEELFVMMTNEPYLIVGHRKYLDAEWSDVLSDKLTSQRP